MLKAPEEFVAIYKWIRNEYALHWKVKTPNESGSLVTGECDLICENTGFLILFDYDYEDASLQIRFCGDYRQETYIKSFDADIKLNDPKMFDKIKEILDITKGLSISLGEVENLHDIKILAGRVYNYVKTTDSH